MAFLPTSSYTPDATPTRKGKIQLNSPTGDIGGTAATPLIKRTSRFIVAPYGDTRPADYTCASQYGNQSEINSAITAANALPQGGVVDLLDGTFYVNSAIIPQDNVWIRGQGMFQTKIGVQPSLGSSFSIIDNFSAHSGSNPNSKKWMITDLELDGSNMNPAFEGKGIFSIKDEDCKIFRVYCHDTTATGIGADDFIKTTITECIVQNCGYLNKHTITAASYSTGPNTFTFTTSGAHGYTAGSSVIVITGMTPSGYNGKYIVTATPSGTTFTVDTSNNSGALQLSRNPGTATGFGLTSDYSIGHSGIGVATGAALAEEAIITNNFCYGNQNNNILFETNNAIAGTKLDQAFIISNNVSAFGGQCGFRNTGSYNVQINNNYDFGSLIGGHVTVFDLTRTITAAGWAANVITFTTSIDHSFSIGNQVIITGMSPTGYNGTYTIVDTPTTATFTVSNTVNPGVATVFGSADAIVHPVEGSTFNNNIFSNNVMYGYYSEPLGDNVSANGNTIKNCQFTGAYIASGKTTFSNNVIYNNGRQGIFIPTGSSTYAVSDLVISSNLIYNNSQNTAGSYDGIEINSSATTPLSHMTITDNIIFDDQVTQTQRYGVLIRNGGNNGYITVSDNDLSRNSTAGILIQDTSNTIYVYNNVGINPQGKSDLGSISGSVTFDSSLASYFRGTVTGNVTATMPANVVNGAIMEWVLVQDGTGGWTITLPGNASTQETFQLSSPANSVDTITWVYDLGTTKWRVLSQSLTKQGTQNMVDGANFALGASTGTKFGTSTAQKLSFYNATPITQPNATTDLGVVLSNLGIRAVGTAYPITTSGAITFTGAVAMNATTLATDTTTGLKIGTSGGASGQKLAFYNATPIVQPLLATGAGHTVDDVITVLQNLGLVRQS